jgi:hypothetical protein
MGMNRRRRGFGWGGGFGGGRRGFGFGGGWGGGGGGNVPGRSGCGGCGCGSIIAVLLVLFLVLMIASQCSGAIDSFGGGGFTQTPVTRSTVRRYALPRNAANTHVPLFTDHLNWINNQTRLQTGMRNFHDRTGVRPHLYLIGAIDGNIRPNASQLEAFAQRRYAELFDDEAHVLLLFFENIHGEYAFFVVAGHQAQDVMDGEARDILMDMVARYYYSDYDTEDMFSRVFDSAGRRIMTVHRSPWIPVFIVAGILLIAYLAFTWWNRKKEQERLQAEETERLLSQPLTTFGSSNSEEARRLAERYTDNT